MRFELDPEAALARGKERLVFQHPERPDRLIKVAKPRPAGAPRRRVVPWSRTWRYGRLKRLMWELRYYVECHARQPDALRLMPAIDGLAETSLGLGLVCEKIDDGAGGLAPTLDVAVARRGADPGLQRLFEELVAALAPGRFVFRDVRPQNIAVAADRLVIVDGFGDIRPVPLRDLLPAYNRRLLMRDLEAMRGHLGL
jgi:hypothetical protein